MSGNGSAVTVEVDRGQYVCGVTDAPNLATYNKDVGLQPNTYNYLVTNWDNAGNAAQVPKPLTLRKCPRHTSGAFIEEDTGILDLLAPLGDDINEFTHDRSVINQRHWQPVHTLPTFNHPPIAISLIQSMSGKLEAIAREGLFGPITREIIYDALVAYESQLGAEWKGPVKLDADDGPIDHVTGTPALIQTDDDQQGIFELLVPRGDVIDHYTLQNDTILQGQWTHHAQKLMPPQNEPLIQFTSVSFTQSTAGILEAIARAIPLEGQADAGQGFLLAYEFDPAPESGLAPAWQGPVKLVADDEPIDSVTGSSAFVQNNQGDFDLLVPRGTVLNHYTHDYGSILEVPWQHKYTLMLPQDDAQAQFTAVWLLQSTSGKLEAVARLKPPEVEKREYLVGYEFDPAIGWKGPVTLASDAGPIHTGPIHPL
jgi:hypothetical protein